MKDQKFVTFTRCFNPPLEVKETYEGYILSEYPSYSIFLRVFCCIFILACAFPLVLISLFAFVAFLVFMSSLASTSPLVFICVLILLIIIVFFGVLFIFQATLANFVLSSGELIFSQYPLKLGSRSHVTFRRKLKFNLKIPENSHIVIKLLCVEYVTYTKGSDKIVETAVIEEKTLYSQPIESGEKEINCNFYLDTPAHLPSSFEASNNKIRWVVVIEQTMPSITKVDSNFTVLVNIHKNL
jgi:predicted signal transduction protein with EAL and GGDEF domain